LKSDLKMIQDIQQHFAETAYQTGQAELHPRMLKVLESVPRSMFVEENLRNEASDDNPLPIGCGQTISQPFIVALMTQILNIQKSDIILEIGTGSGYQTAILAHLAKHVYTIERIASLAEKAKERLKNLHLNNITTIISDGSLGWDNAAPYDSILVAAAANEIPLALKSQLKMNGRMIIPIGIYAQKRNLKLVTKKSDTNFEVKTILDVCFVPLIADN